MAEETALPKGDAVLPHAQAIDELRSMTHHDADMDVALFDRRCQLLNGLGRTKIHFGDRLQLTFRWTGELYLRDCVLAGVVTGKGGLARAVAILADSVVRADGMNAQLKPAA